MMGMNLKGSVLDIDKDNVGTKHLFMACLFENLLSIVRTDPFNFKTE